MIAGFQDGSAIIYEYIAEFKEDTDLKYFPDQTRFGRILSGQIDEDNEESKNDDPDRTREGTYGSVGGKVPLIISRLLEDEFPQSGEEIPRREFPNDQMYNDYIALK